MHIIQQRATVIGHVTVDIMLWEICVRATITPVALDNTFQMERANFVLWFQVMRILQLRDHVIGHVVLDIRNQEIPVSQ